MLRWYTLVGIGFALLAVGGMAGQRMIDLNSEQPRSDKPADDVPNESAAPVGPSDSRAVEDVSSTLPDGFLQFASLSQPAEQFDIAEDTAEREADPAVTALIQRMFPELDADTLTVWSESCTGMAIDDVEFLLEQRKHAMPQSNSYLSHEVVATIQGPSPSTPGFGGTTTATLTRDAAIEVVETNLRNAWSPGYRRMVVLPESSPAMMDSHDFAASWTWSLDCGPVTATTNPLHIALPDDSRLMFSMDDGSLTRRGDFRLLSDRRIGLVTRSGELSLANSPVVPETAAHVAIQTDATVTIRSAGSTSDNSWQQIGSVCIVRLTTSEALQGTGGTFFRTASQPEVLAVGTVVVRPSSLEMSNVELARERQLSDMLTAGDHDR